MDHQLSPADPLLVRRLMARAVLSAPPVEMQQGRITLAPHQLDAASRILSLLARCGGAVLADATGLGKTYVAIAVARTRLPVVVVAPAALRGMWRNSLGLAQLPACVLSYEELSRGFTSPATRPRLVILDEAHHVRNPRTRRYDAVADLTWGAQVLILTATPIHNRTRDLRSLVALFLGSRAEHLRDKALAEMIVRREASDVSDASRLPTIETTRWIEVPGDPATLAAIRALPPAVPPADGGSAHALLLLGLIRAWTSSEWALRATLRRRLQRALALDAALESGRLPTRDELKDWPAIDDAIQLGFPELLAGSFPSPDAPLVRAAIAEHVAGVRAIISSLDGGLGIPDNRRIDALRVIRERANGSAVVAFSQYADTAEASFRRCLGDGGVALVTGRGAFVASGRLQVDEIVHGFDVPWSDPGRALPLDMLIATDVLSEGLSLRRARVLVHLDLPWTVARLEQRLGRLRRLGSPHASISVYAIGPSIASRELVAVIRALQRKARLTSNVVGNASISAAMPLFGARFERATRLLAKRNSQGAVEELRRELTEWLRTPPRALPAGVSIALVERPGRCSLVTVWNGGASEDPRDVLNAITGIGFQDVRRDDGVREVTGSLESWLEGERGRQLADLDAPASPAHGAILRWLQTLLMHATRTERVAQASRIDECRRLVMASHGAGVERVLARCAQSLDTLSVDYVCALLKPRAAEAHEDGLTRLVAILCTGKGGGLAWLAEGARITDESHLYDRPTNSRFA